MKLRFRQIFPVKYLTAAFTVQILLFPIQYSLAENRLRYNAFVSAKADTLMINAANELTTLYLQKNKFDSAFLFAKAAESKSERIAYLKGKAVAELNLAKCFKGYSSYDKSIRYLIKARNLFEKIQDKTGMIICEMESGILYYTQKKYAEANRFFLLGLNEALDLNDSLYTAKFYYLSGLTLTETADYTKAEKHLQKAAALMDELGLLKRSWEAKTGLADLYARTGKTTQAQSLYNNALLYFRKIGENEGISVCYLGLGKILRSEGNFEIAVANFDSAYTIASKSKFYLVAEPAAGLLSDLYLQIKKTDLAYKYQKLYYEIRENVMSAENMRAVLSMQSELELSRKQTEIEELDRKRLQARTTNYTLIGLGLLLSILAYIIYKRYRAEHLSKIALDRERKRSENLLLNILPEHTAEELKSNGKATPKFHDHATVLFADIVDFTLRAEILSPKELVAELDYCFSKMDEIIDKHGLEKIKTIGDAYMCAGGLTGKSDAGSVLDAALEIREFILDYQEISENAIAGPIVLRMGINTGPVIAGVVGSRKFAYDIWGDTVNLAARMQQHGEPGKIAVSESTYALIKTDFICSLRGEIHAKNKGKVKMFFVDGRILN